MFLHKPLVSIATIYHIVDQAIAVNDFIFASSTSTSNSPIPNALPPPPSPTSTAAALILQQNTACSTLGSILSICTSLIPSFTALAPTVQASCLCYSSAAYLPSIFDDAVEVCADYAFTAWPAAYTPIANLQSFCSNFGPLPTLTYEPGDTSIGPISACNIVSSYLGACASLTPDFMNMLVTDQASCLCYVSKTIWAPSGFDGAVGGCEQLARTGNPAIFTEVASFAGFCRGVGDIMGSTGTSMVTSYLDVTTTASGLSTSIKASMSTSAGITGTAEIIQPTASQGVGIGTNKGGTKKASDGDVIVVSLACAMALLFLC